MKKLIALFLGSLLLIGAGCNSTKRFGKDAFITVTSPFVILYGASTDTMSDVTNIQAGLDASPWVQPFFFPFAFLWRTVDHTFSCAFHAIDMVAYPFYGLAELNDFGPEIKPLDIYRGTIFDDMVGEEPAADAETGEQQN
ncbi:MAG: hypothetical protein R3F30_06885 [Planctomycetota bacterium]